MKLLITGAEDNPPKTVKKQKGTQKAVTTENPLIVTVQDAITKMDQTNSRAIELIESVTLSLSRELPTPVIQMEAPAINIPAYPPQPDPPRQWRVTVTRRDAKGFIQEVDLERIK